MNNDPASFDIVIIGTPMWNHRLSTPIRTYCTEYKNRFREVAFFSTCDSADDNPFDETEAICGKKLIATLRLHRKKEAETDQYVKKAAEFVDTISGNTITANQS